MESRETVGGIALLPGRLLMYLYILELFDEAKVWTRLDS